MTEYSVGEVRRHAEYVLDKDYQAASAMLTAYADLLEQIERAREGVTANKAFEREDRYFVVKKSHCSEDQISALERLFDAWKIRTVQCVVVEADWPEHEPVWSMIKARMTNPPAQAAQVPVYPVRIGIEDVDVEVSTAEPLAQGEAVAWQSKRRPADYPDEWRECSREIFDMISRTPDSPWIARELFDRAQPRVVPEGHVLVPREPTPDMLKAGAVWMNSDDKWSAMLAAAPSQEPQS